MLHQISRCKGKAYSKSKELFPRSFNLFLNNLQNTANSYCTT